MRTSLKETISLRTYCVPLHKVLDLPLRNLNNAGVLQVTIIAVGAFSMQQWRGPAWNSPIWPMLPLLLNRFIEIGALLLKNHFTSITVCPLVAASWFCRPFCAACNLDLSLCLMEATCVNATMTATFLCCDIMLCSCRHRQCKSFLL